MDRQEERDHKYEVFVLEQAKRYADMNAKCVYIYILLAIACIVMGVVGIILGKSILKAIVIMAWSLGFYAAKKYYELAAADTYKIAGKIEAAINDPDFDIPDQYDDDVLALRELVNPTLKNVISQAVAYGIIALSLWAAAILFFFLAGPGSSDFSFGFLLLSLLMGAMGFALTLLSVRAIRDIPAAKAYEQYLNESAAGEEE